MTTIAFLHAHPDDESSQTAGTMAMAVDAGYRVIVIFATDGDFGTAASDLAEGESVADRRQREATASAAALGLHGVHWLGYADSGMTGWPQNDDPACLARAPLEESARRVADVLDAEGADVLVGYDWHGNYGHPDHVAVHRIAYRAAELAARTPLVLEETMNRDALRRRYQAALAAGETEAWDPDAPADDGNPVGSPESELNWAVDLDEAYLARKRAAMTAHASQTSDVGMMLQLPPEVFAAQFGVEYYRQEGNTDPLRHAWPFPPA